MKGKSDIVEAVRNDCGFTKEQAKAAVGKVFDYITEQLSAGEKISLIGFGTFEVAERPERQGRNPRTGETTTIAASKTPKFKAGKGLKDAVNK